MINTQYPSFKIRLNSETLLSYNQKKGGNFCGKIVGFRGKEMHKRNFLVRLKEQSIHF